jgi:hypothetical protein
MFARQITLILAVAFAVVGVSAQGTGKVSDAFSLWLSP